MFWELTVETPHIFSLLCHNLLMNSSSYSYVSTRMPARTVSWPPTPALKNNIERVKQNYEEYPPDRSDNIMTIEDDILKLAELDQQVTQAVIDVDAAELGRVLDAYIELRASLKKQALDEPTILVRDEVACEKLRQLMSSKGLPSDRMLTKLQEITGTDLTIDEFGEADIEELGVERFYSWYSHNEFVRALAELRPLILQYDVSDRVKRLVWQVMRCYAFQQYDAALGLCRTLLEASMRDICEQKKLFPNKSEEDVLYKYIHWNKLRNRVCCGELNEKLKGHYKRLSEVLHARRRETTAMHVREAFRETLLRIEELYGFHGL